MPKATVTIKAIFQDNSQSMTMADILAIAPELKKNEISMALCHLLKQGKLTRVKTQRSSTRGRKEVWQYAAV